MSKVEWLYDTRTMRGIQSPVGGGLESGNCSNMTSPRGRGPAMDPREFLMASSQSQDVNSFRTFDPPGVHLVDTLGRASPSWKLDPPTSGIDNAVFESAEDNNHESTTRSEQIQGSPNPQDTSNQHRVASVSPDDVSSPDISRISFQDDEVGRGCGIPFATSTLQQRASSQSLRSIDDNFSLFSNGSASMPTQPSTEQYRSSSFPVLKTGVDENIARQFYAHSSFTNSNPSDDEQMSISNNSFGIPSQGFSQMYSPTRSTTSMSTSSQPNQTRRAEEASQSASRHVSFAPSVTSSPDVHEKPTRVSTSLNTSAPCPLHSLDIDSHDGTSISSMSLSERLTRPSPFTVPRTIPVGAPMMMLHTFYGQQNENVQIFSIDYFTWDNGGEPHIRKFTSVFLCPLTGELFLSGKYSASNVSPRMDTNDNVTIFWHRKKKEAEQAAAARACLSRYGPASKLSFANDDDLAYVPFHVSKMNDGCPGMPHDVQKKLIDRDAYNMDAYGQAKRGLVQQT